MSPAVYGSSPAPFMVCVYFEVSVNCPSNICLLGQYFTVDKVDSRGYDSDTSPSQLSSLIVIQFLYIKDCYTRNILALSWVDARMFE